MDSEPVRVDVILRHEDVGNTGGHPFMEGVLVNGKELLVPKGAKWSLEGDAGSWVTVKMEIVANHVGIVWRHELDAGESES